MVRFILINLNCVPSRIMAQFLKYWLTIILHWLVFAVIVIAILKTSFPIFTEMNIWSVMLIMNNRWYWSFREVVLVILNMLNLEINRKRVSYAQPEIGSTTEDNRRRNDYERILKRKVNNRSMFFLHLGCRFFICMFTKLTVYLKKELTPSIIMIWDFEILLLIFCFTKIRCSMKY